ncbi:hypothetical protein QFC21_001441 [Naganishia friedmannii]|uniref:Uncharacterized protein n=1 Tax=Naganishia friedmannii TaxID=89922 RepID=A0ACC2W4F7_9TREE|nr:hypothetical protein QFC21_001441 [Naganishia friedmannii]
MQDQFFELENDKVKQRVDVAPSSVISVQAQATRAVLIHQQQHGQFKVRIHTHGFAKPNDKAALDLMDRAAKRVMEEVPDVVVGFGESDEYSKIVTLIVSCFTSAYVFYWTQYMPKDRILQYPPIFDGRIVQYPSEKEVKDYFKWRAVDTHINNLYNTTFWALVLQGGQSTTQANETLSEQHNDESSETAIPTAEDARKASNPLFGHKQKKKPRPVVPFDGTNGEVVVLHVDMVRDDFWNERPWLLR